MTGKQLVLFALLLGLGGCKENKKEPVPVGTDRLIDHVRLTDLENKPIDLEQYKGQTIFLNIWATWCKPCKEEMPSIASAQQILKDKKIVFILASGENLEEIQAFKAANNYPFYFTRLEESEGLSIPGLPTTFIFDNRGSLVFMETGSRKWDEKNNIDTLLKIALP